MSLPDQAESAGATGPLELVAIECDGCKAYVPLTRMRGTDPITRQRVQSSHAGRLHEGCTAKGTWRARWQLSLALGSTTRDPREAV